jgi:hypothetical protein
MKDFVSGAVGRFASVKTRRLNVGEGVEDAVTGYKFGANTPALDFLVEIGIGPKKPGWAECGKLLQRPLSDLICTFGRDWRRGNRSYFNQKSLAPVIPVREQTNANERCFVRTAVTR